MNRKVRLGKPLDLVAGKERPRWPDEVNAVGPDDSDAGSVNTENEAIMWDEDGLRCEVTDRKGRNVRLNHGEGFINFTKF